jgi:protein ImuB
MVWPGRGARDGGTTAQVVGWAGPWPLDERWWEPGGYRRVLLQVVLDDGHGMLLASRVGPGSGSGSGGNNDSDDNDDSDDSDDDGAGWVVEAVYD